MAAAPRRRGTVQQARGRAATAPRPGRRGQAVQRARAIRKTTAQQAASPIIRAAAAARVLRGQPASARRAVAMPVSPSAQVAQAAAARMVEAAPQEQARLAARAQTAVMVLVVLVGEQVQSPHQGRAPLAAVVKADMAMETRIPAHRVASKCFTAAPMARPAAVAAAAIIRLQDMAAAPARRTDGVRAAAAVL